MVKIIERTTYRDDDTLENTTRQIEIPGKLDGSTMLAAVMNLHGWNLVMKDQSKNTSIIIHGDNESELLELKRLLTQTKISIAILIPLNLPEHPPSGDS